MEFEVPLSCCDLDVGSGGTSEGLFCRQVTPHSLCKTTRQPAIIGTTVCKEEQQQRSGYFLRARHCALLSSPVCSPCKCSTTRRNWKDTDEVPSASHSLRFAPNLLGNRETVSGYPLPQTSASHVTDRRMHVLIDI